MRVTIIKDDNVVMVGGAARTVDCSSLPADFHALQWYDMTGEVEFAATFEDRGWHKKPNQLIKDLSPYQKYVDAWNAAGLKS